jgi:hypothetical protein
MIFETQNQNLKFKNKNLNQISYSKNYKKIIEEEYKKDPRYKTELCQKFMETGNCPYGFKCRFAHGKNELNSKILNINYKKKPCKRFYKYGFCPYGSRCLFLHNDRKIRNINLPYFYIMTFIDFITLNKRLPVFKNLEFDNNNINKDKISNSSTSSNSNCDDEEFVIYNKIFLEN